MKAKTKYSGGMVRWARRERLGGFLRRQGMAMLLLFALLSLLPRWAAAQTGREFWFDVPEMNRFHNPPGQVVLKVASADETQPAEVTIELPARPDFQWKRDMVNNAVPGSERVDGGKLHFTVAPATEAQVYLYKHFWRQASIEADFPTNEPNEYLLENVLQWSESNMKGGADARNYINRTKNGVRMTSTTNISAYILYPGSINMDLIALKGPNAKGRDFWIPFQTTFWTADWVYNDYVSSYKNAAYSSFNITATADNTKIEITVPHDIWVKGDAVATSTPLYGGRAQNGHILKAGTHTIWLNEGETSIITPYGTKPYYPRGAYQVAREPGKRLMGSHVKVVEGGDVVVLTKDDLLASWGKQKGDKSTLEWPYGKPEDENINGDTDWDQLVPTPFAGTDYGVVHGTVNSDNNADIAYVLATEDNTVVYVQGARTWNPVKLNAGEHRGFHLASTKVRATAIHATKPVVVYHLGGVPDQKAGAVLPALPKGSRCIGSREVVFTRAYNYPIDVNILAWDVADPAKGVKSAIGGFEVQELINGRFQKGTSRFATQLERKLNNPATYSSFAAGPNFAAHQKWKYAQINAGDAKMTPYRVINRNNVFHLGYTNGKRSANGLYGYFSDYSILKVSLDNVKLDKYSQVAGSKGVDLCLGDTAVLDVPLSRQFSYTWSAPSDPSAMQFLYNSNSYNSHDNLGSRVYVKGINKPVRYRVTVRGMCDVEESQDINLNLTVMHDPVFTADPVVCVRGKGDPPVRVGLHGLDGADKVKWRVLPDGTATIPDDDGLQSESVVHELALEYKDQTGPGGALVPRASTVIAEVHKGGCMRQYSRTVQVMRQPVTPVIQLNLPASACSEPDGHGGYSRTLQLSDVHVGEAMAGQQYLIKYGDGNEQRLPLSALRAGVTYTFPARASGYTVQLQTEDAMGSCSARAADVVIESKVVPQVSLTAGPSQFCSGSQQVRVENSTQAATRYAWSYKTEHPGGVVVQDWRAAGSGAQLSLTGPEFNGGWLTARDAPLTYVFKLAAENAGCTATDEVRVTVLPAAAFAGLLSPRRTGSVDPCGPYEYEYEATGARGVARYEWRWRRVGDATWQPFATGGAVADGASLTVKHAFTNETAQDQQYEVQLAAWASEGGCGWDKTFPAVTVPPSFVVRLEGPRVSVCPLGNGEREVVLKNLTAGGGPGVTYAWEIDGAASPQAVAGEFRHTFTNTDTHNSRTFVVRLTARQGLCTQTAETEVELYPRVSPGFSLQEVDPASGTAGALLVHNGEYCSPLQMRGAARGAEAYTWVTSLDGREVTRSEGATYAYAVENSASSARRLTVTLLGTNAKGCSGRASQEYVLRPGLDATVLAEVTQACTPDTRVRVSAPGQQTNPASARYELQGNDWEQLTGDPRTQPDGSAVRFRMPGTYRLTLRVQDGPCTAEGVSNPITILPGVQPALEPLGSLESQGCTPHAVTLRPVQQSLAGATWVRWDFGDGSYASQAGSVTHTYFAPAGATPAEYTVRLTAGNNTQCDARSQAAEAQVKVFPAPAGGGNVAAPADPCAPEIWRLENLQPAGTADEVVWTFTPVGGGAPVEQRGALTDYPRDVQLPNPQANDPQRYTYQQVAYRQWAGGPRCASQPYTGEVTVEPKLQPQLAMALAQGSGCGRAEVTFTDNSTGGAVQHTWTLDGKQTYTTDRGDPLSLTLTNESSLPQDHTVRVESRQTQSDGRQCVRQWQPDFQVRVFPTPRATIAWTVDDWCAVPLTVQARATGVPADAQCEWRTDAPQTERSVGNVPVQLQFTNAGPEDDKVFTIRLTAEQRWAGGPACRGDATPVTVTVPAPPKAKLEVKRAEHAPACGSLAVTLDGQGSTGLSKPGSSYTWSFGDGAQLTGATASHTYHNQGFDGTDERRKVVLTVRNAAGCTAQATTELTVHPEVMARFSLHTAQLCTPFEAEIENLSLNGQTYTWQLRNPDETLTPSDPMHFSYTFTNASATATLHRQLQLTATAQHGDGVTCTSVSAPQAVTVPPQLAPSFRLTTPPAGCSPLTVAVENTTPKGMVVNGTYTWGWGTLHTATGEGPHSYTVENDDRAASLRVPVWLEVSDAQGCHAKTPVQEVEVYAAVTADFSASPLGGCSPLTVEVTNTRPSPAYAYTWTLGSQGASTRESPGTLTYTNPHLDRAAAQREQLVLETRLAAHPECKARKEVTVEVWPRVIADFALSKTAGCDPLEVTVQDKTQSAPGVRQYVWEASDGQRWLTREPTITLRNPSRVAERTVDLSVRVELKDGCSDTWRSQLTVYPTPQSGFAIVGDARGCSPFKVSLEDQAAGKDVSYRYDFGDGKVLTGEYAGVPMEHVYSNRGAVPESYLLVQRVTSPQGCWAETRQQVHVNPQVTADFGIQPGTSGCSPFAVTVSNHSINATRFEWNFGDGATSTQENPGHEYVNIAPNDAVHKLQCRAFSDYGCSDQLEKEVMVYASPMARFEVTPPAQLFPSTRVTVDNQSQPRVAGWDYHWAWGDGQSTQGVSPEPHVYGIWGDPEHDFIIPITLTVTSAHCQSVARKEVIIRAPKPAVEFTANRLSGCPPLEVQMLNETKYATSAVWHFNDGTPPSSEPEPRHVFTEPGSYHVRLVAEGPGGQAEQFVVFEVFQRPAVAFKVEPAHVFLPGAEVQALNLSVDAHSFRWDFGDGTTSLEESPRHVYEAPGRYTVKLSGLSQQGCEGSATLDDAVFVDGSGRVRFPTAFRPSGDGGTYGLRDHNNTVFHPYIDGSVQDYKLMVFTRWGEKIFQTTDVQEGWDGTFRGAPCAMGVYAWRAVGTFYDGSVFDVKGNVTLLR